MPSFFLLLNRQVHLLAARLDFLHDNFGWLRVRTLFKGLVLEALDRSFIRFSRNVRSHDVNDRAAVNPNERFALRKLVDEGDELLPLLVDSAQRNLPVFKRLSLAGATPSRIIGSLTHFPFEVWFDAPRVSGS